MEKIEKVNEILNSDPKIDYIDYTNLPDLKDDEITDEKINIQIKNLTEIPKWEINFNSLIFFRSLNKKNPFLLKKYLNILIPYLNNLSNSIRSGISKLTLILLGEILNLFQFSNEENDYEILNKIFFIVFHLSFSPKIFIKNEVKKIIEKNVINNNNYQNNFFIIIELIDLMKNEKNIVSENIFEVYENLIKKIDFNNNNIDKKLWKKFFIKIDELNEKKKEIYTKKFNKILLKIYNELKKEKFENILKEIEKEDEKINLYKSIIEKNSNKKNFNSQLSFKEFRQQQQKLMRLKTTEK
jgi:hypothetical protein